MLVYQRVNDLWSMEIHFQINSYGFMYNTIFAARLRPEWHGLCIVDGYGLKTVTV